MHKRRSIIPSYYTIRLLGLGLNTNTENSTGNNSNTDKTKNDNNKKTNASKTHKNNVETGICCVFCRRSGSEGELFGEFVIAAPRKSLWRLPS